MNLERSIRRCIALAAVGLLALAGALPAASAAESRALIQGSGSGWSANAVNQWVADVQSNGLQVVYTAAGSAQGRKDFGYRTNDFAVSDIGFQGVDAVTGDTDTSQGRDYAYLPIVAGGTAFPYHIEVGGELLKNLRLSGDSLAKIFTGQITNWSDAQITKDNNGRKLPSIPIIPVVHSEGSGSTAQLTRYFDAEHPDVWRPYLGKAGDTEYYPRKGNMIAQNGSDGVMNYVASSSANGAIGYDEYSYALGKNYPVAKILNKSGYFTLPTQYNVAVALTRADINGNPKSPNYLLQDLKDVYTYSDNRTYPLSSYSYGIIPTASDDDTMTTAKRQTLADFLYYSVCQGQREIGPIGYSPLPINLVEASFDQIGQLKKADKAVNLENRNVSTCDNPTFIAGQPNRNYLAEIAPPPPECDKVGNGPCEDEGFNGVGDPPPSGEDENGGGGNDPDNDPGPGGPTTGGGGPGGPTDGNQPINPETGLPFDENPTATAADVAGVPTDIAAFSSSQSRTILALLAIALLVAVVAVPPVMNRRMKEGTS